jgi:phosphoenolpyruvate carboxylase
METNNSTSSLKKYEFSKWDEDVLFLRNTLHETLLELGMPEIANLLPWGTHELSSDSVTLPLTERAIQTFSLCFQLLNMVEENTANQIRRENGYSGEGLWEDAFEHCKKSHKTAAELNDFFSNIHIEPVLTAHPTEAKRATVLEHHRRLYLLLVKAENRMWSDLEREGIRDDIKSLLECLLRTGDLYLERPEVADELRNITYYLKSTFPSALQVLGKRFRQSWEQHYPDDATRGAYPSFPKLTFGTWVGGDRDGHPFVDSTVTRETLRTLRTLAIENINESLIQLVRVLSLNDRLQAVPEPLHKRTNELIALLGPDISEHCLKRNPGEPWRQFLNLVIASMPPAEGTPENIHYKESTELVRDLELLRNALVEIGAKRLAYAEVEPVIVIARAFGFHLATLDIRQNSAFHDRAISQLIKAAGYEDHAFSEWSVEKRTAFLNDELDNRRPFVQPSVSVGKEGDEVRKTLQVIAEHGRIFGFEGIGSLIISMTRDLSDLLSVYVLAKESELAVWGTEGLHCPVPVVPLFETIDDLKRSFSVVRDFVSHPVSILSNHYLEQVAPEQARTYQIMIGYSDSSKDGGVLSSYWNLYHTQEQLTEIGKKENVRFRFFHGRGGTISRGAGPTGRFLAALPPGSFASGLRMTEQGETISQKYANLLTASYNLELLHAGTIIHGITACDHKVSELLAKGNRLLSDISQKAYQDLLSHKDFVRFFRHATPIDIIEHSRFGSRPPKRTGAETLDDLRAIPWVFSWNQSRFFLSSWYGVGTALSSLKRDEPDTWKTLVSEINSWAPSKYIFTNIESSIFSASAHFMEAYSNLVTDSKVRDDIMQMILSEYELSKSMITELFKVHFETRRPRLFRTLEYREKPLEILHNTQIHLLKEWRKTQNEDTLAQLLLVTNAIAGGLRTTG